MKLTKPLICFYGDDFTGSTDALESLALAGVRTVLFVEPPSAAQLARYPNLQAFGVAGMTRSMAPRKMNAVLDPALRALRNSAARHVHYKVCSTFDSSPRMGSIGHVIDLGWRIFKPRFIPLLVGAPALGRHCVFGNLFARCGADGEPIRLDRHPSMRQHPVTPMDESDLRLHLGPQTSKRVALFDVLKLGRPLREQQTALANIVRARAEVVLFDVLYQEQLRQIGKLIDSYAGTEPLFSIGSSGVEMALTAHWLAQRKIEPPRAWPAVGPAKPFLVVCGSCSPVTHDQIKWGLRHGFAEVPFTFNSKNQLAVSAAADAVIEHLKAGRNVIVHSLRIGSGSGAMKTHPSAVGPGIGEALGQITCKALANVKVSRLCVAGGDTSGHVARVLGIEALEILAPLVRGAPLCRAHALGSSAHGLEVNFKGGQVGAPDYFTFVQNGQC